MFDALVVDAGLRQSLVAVRSLGRRGLVVGALDSVPAPAFVSRWCRQGMVGPSGPAEDYIAHLDEWLRLNGARVLIPSADGTILRLRERRAQIEKRVHLALADEDAMAIAVSKERTLAIAEGLGIKVPRGQRVRSLDELPAALAVIGLPAVVKPSESCLDGEHAARVTCRLVTTRAEAERAVIELTRSAGVTLFQELLPGRREAVSFIYAGGEIHARFAQWAQRTGPPLGGESVLRQSIAVPDDIGEQAERLVRAIDLEGYSEVEFRRDAAGVPYLMEINPRLSASVEIAVRAGVDFPWLLYQWATGGPIDRAAGYRTGGWMRYLKGDLMSTVASIKERGRPGIATPARAVLDFGLTFLKPMSYDYVDWNDPLPGVKALEGFTRQMARLAIDRSLARLRKHQR